MLSVEDSPLAHYYPPASVVAGTNFKSFNDLHGHPAGDEALKAVARNLVLLLRDTDGVYRYGGEEFLLILPDQGALDAEAAVERIRSGIEALAITHYGNPRQVLTISAGISTFSADHPVGSGQLLKEADDALYTAKAAGRNRVASFVRAGEENPARTKPGVPIQPGPV